MEAIAHMDAQTQRVTMHETVAARTDRVNGLGHFAQRSAQGPARASWRHPPA